MPRSTAKRTVGQSVKQSWDCSQFGNEEEEEEEVWREENQMESSWAEDGKLEEILEQRRGEGNALKVDVMQKAPELVVHEHMAQGEKVTSAEVKKKAREMSTEEMKDQANSHQEDDTEEMRTWRGLNQDEMDHCWKKLVESMEEEVLDKYKVEDSKRGAYRGRGFPLKWRRVRRSKKYRIRKWREDCWTKIVALFREYNLQRRQSTHEDSTEEEEKKGGNKE